MRIFLTLLGLLFIIFGAVSFTYQGFSYKTKEDVAEIKIPDVGHLQLTETKEKKLEVPPLLAAGSIGVGILFVLLGVFRKKR